MTKAFTAALLSAITLAASDLPTVYESDFTEHWFDNKIDHFNYQHTTTYKQRYWRNDVYCADEAKCPIFIYICGEYTCSVPAFRFYPFMIGAEHGAQLFVLEHRYYGQSQPYENWSTENLVHLSSEQALADLASFLTAQGAGDQKKTLVIGGSYPGALSAWFRVHYPQIAAASWSSSGVVQPIVDFWHFDEQIYISTIKSGEFCPLAIQKSTAFVTQQAALRDNGEQNVIDTFLESVGQSGMRSDDFMFYYADIFVEGVQYGNRTTLCQLLKENQNSTDEEIFNAVTAFGANVAGVNPPDYDTRELAKTEINFNTSGRQWTYQYCTEYGWFQVPSRKNPMRSPLLEMEFWPKMCERVFEGLDMTGLPQAQESTISESGFNNASTNTFFTNGVEDPWQWATVRQVNDSSTQRARTSDCDDCGHCVEMYTPTDSDPIQVQETRDEIRQWIGGIFGQPAATAEQFLS